MLLVHQFVLIAHQIGIHIVLFAKFVNDLLQLFRIIACIIGSILARLDGFAVIDRKDNHGLVGLLASHLKHGREQQEGEQRHRDATQGGHRDAGTLLEDHVVVPVIEEQGVTYTQQHGENRQPKRILCK